MENEGDEGFKATRLMLLIDDLRFIGKSTFMDMQHRISHDTELALKKEMFDIIDKIIPLIKEI